MKKNINILIVEDDSDINDLLYRILSKEGYSVTCSYSGTEAKMCISQNSYHLILLDLMIPGISGQELLAEIRKSSNMPVIVISAMDSQNVKIDLLRLGADDFISKPFDVNEVSARVEAQLRRYIVFSSTSEQQILHHKNITLDKANFKVYVSDKELILTGREFEILNLLLSNPTKVFTKANLFQSVWKDNFIGDENTVNVHISNLRSKIHKLDKDTEYIHTVWGIGYRLSE